MVEPIGPLRTFCSIWCIILIVTNSVKQIADFLAKKPQNSRSSRPDGAVFAACPSKQCKIYPDKAMKSAVDAGRPAQILPAELPSRRMVVMYVYRIQQICFDVCRRMTGRMPQPVYSMAQRKKCAFSAQRSNADGARLRQIGCRPLICGHSGAFLYAVYALPPYRDIVSCVLFDLVCIQDTGDPIDSCGAFISSCMQYT